MHISQQQLDELKQRTGQSLARVIGCTNDGNGELVGSGTFVDLFGTVYLATAEHVVRERYAKHTDGTPRYDGLSHDVGHDAVGYVIDQPFYGHGMIRDVSVAKLRAEDFRKGTITPLKMETVPQLTPPLADDILFLQGYPGEKSRFVSLLGGIFSDSFPWVCAEEPTNWSQFNPAIHFAIGYPHEGMGESGSVTSLPNPGGMSGSAIWKTNIVPRGALWTIDDIQMIGIAMNYNQESRVIIGTRIEYLWVLLFHAIQCQYAHDRWVERGSPEGDDWADWFSAEKHVQLLQNASWLTPAWKQLWTPWSRS